MSYKNQTDCDLYLDRDLLITKSSPIFDKKRGDASVMFYPRDLKEILALRDGESICAEIATAEKGVAFVKRTDDGYLVRHIGIAGELYSALLKRGEKIDLTEYKPAAKSAKARSHFVEIVRILNTISSAVYRPYNVSDAPVYRIVREELRLMGFSSIFAQGKFVCARVSPREYNLLVASAVATCASFALGSRMSLVLYKLGDLAVFSATAEFGGSDDDRKAIIDRSFGSEHSDLAMLEMLCGNIDWQFVCDFEGIDDRFLRVGFAFPTVEPKAGVASFLSPEQPIDPSLESTLRLQFARY